MDPDCSGPLAQDTTHDDGRVELSIPSVTNFDVYLAVDAAPEYDPHLLFGPLRPRFTEEYSGNGMPRRADLDATLKSVGAAFDPTRAYVFAQFFDCGGLWSHDLVAELWTFDQAMLEPIYAVNSYPTFDAEHTTAGFGTQAFFMGVEPVPVALVARDRSSGKRVARAELILRPGHVHMLGLQPLTTALAGVD